MTNINEIEKLNQTAALLKKRIVEIEREIAILEAEKLKLTADFNYILFLIQNEDSVEEEEKKEKEN